MGLDAAEPPAGGRDGPATLRVAGDVDLATVAALESRLEPFLVADPPPSRLVVDLSDVAFLDCAGLRPLLRARVRLGPALVLAGLQPAVARFLRLAGVHSFFTVLDAPSPLPHPPA